MTIEPQIQYCTTSDGVSIAYWTLGEGRPVFVSSPLTFCHAGLEVRIPQIAAFYERIAAKCMLVRWDVRNHGMSQRGVDKLGIEKWASDVFAVADKLGLESFDFVGINAHPTLAALQPERVRRLVLVAPPPPRLADLLDRPDQSAVRSLAEKNWHVYTETLASFLEGWNADPGLPYSHFIRESINQEDYLRQLVSWREWDCSEYLTRITCPTLIVSASGGDAFQRENVRTYAAAIRQSRLVEVDGVLGLQNVAVADIIDRFVMEEEGAPSRKAMPRPIEATIVPRAAAPKAFASGRYTVRGLLGEGGQKVVYLVHDEALDRDCALSMVKSELLEPDDLERLRREAQAMARLGAHSNIVTVHDIGDEDGKPYLVCEYVPAGELRRHLRDAGAPLPLERTLAICADIARALTVAHGRGVIHRDLKPANVWLCDDGSAKLGDFGLAFSLDRTRMTLPGSAMGTATYMAPEQARGEPVDARTDLYALGVVLYEMVCGRAPFSGDDPLSVISQHTSVAPNAPVLHVADLPPALNELILRLLAKAPDERPESAAMVLDELRRIGDGLHVPEASREPETEPEHQPAEPGFVGRTTEQAQLAAALERTARGAGSLVMVVGEPGIGKTRLLEQFAAHARDAGARVLTGRCYDGDWAPPFSPFVEAIKQHAAATSAQRLRADLGADVGVLARIVPSLHERLPNIAEPPQIPAEGERYRLLEAVSETLGRLAAERPLVLVLDDLHWADKGTIAMLQQVARTSATQRVLVLGAYRDVELDRTHPLADALAGLRREKHFDRISLRGLDGAEVAELFDTIVEQDVPAPLAEAIASETEGNPFFIKEVLLHLVEEGKIVQGDGAWASKLSIAEMGIPEGVREVIGRRLSRVSETCGRMLALASALTAGFSWEVISAISDAGDAALLDAVDEALGAQLIVEGERGRYDFTHALIRHTLYEELSTPRRVLLHRQIGEALERVYAGAIEPHLAELAHHLYEAAPGGDVQKAVDYARRAGERAMAQVAWEQATANYERALQAMDLMPIPDERIRVDVLLALGRALDRGGADRARWRAVFQRAAELARSAGDHERCARAALGFASLTPTPGVVDAEVVRLLEGALQLLGPAESALRAMVLARLGSELTWSEERERMKQLLADALQMARRVDDPETLAYVLARHFWEDMDAAQALSLGREQVDAASRSGDKHAELRAHNVLAAYMLIHGDRTGFDRTVEEEERLQRELRIVDGYTGFNRALQAQMDGQFDAAERMAGQAFAELQHDDPENAAQSVGAVIFDLRRHQGRLLELEPAIKSTAERYPAIPAWGATLAAVYASDVRRRDDARAAFDGLAELGFGQLPADALLPVTLKLLADVCWVLGDAARAPELYRLLLPREGECVVVGWAVTAEGAVSRSLALLAATMRHWEDAERHFEDALSTNAQLRDKPWLAQTRAQYGAVLLARSAPGDRERARGLLERALATAQEIGMAKVAADCEALLAAEAQ